MKSPARRISKRRSKFNPHGILGDLHPQPIRNAQQPYARSEFGQQRCRNSIVCLRGTGQRLSALGPESPVDNQLQVVVPGFTGPIEESVNAAAFVNDDMLRVASRKQPASRSQASATAGRRARSSSPVCWPGGSEGRELLLHPFPSALRALRRLLVARQDEFFEDVSAVGTGILKDGHCKSSSLLRFDVTAFLLGVPRRGAPTPRSRKT